MISKSNCIRDVDVSLQSALVCIPACISELETVIDNGLVVEQLAPFVSLDEYCVYC